jgi:hypothetical protein
MSWFERQKANLARYFYHRRSRKSRPKHDFVSLGKAQKIGILIHVNVFNLRLTKQIAEYVTHLEKNGKQVYIIELNTKKNADPVFSDIKLSIFLNIKYFNWLGIPDHFGLAKINKHHLDILIDLDTSDSLFSRFVTGLSNARMRVGIHREGTEPYYDMMIAVKPDTPSDTMLSQIENYLNMIHK